MVGKFLAVKVLVLRLALYKCVSIVRLDIWSKQAIPLLFLPSARRNRISISMVSSLR